MDGNLESLPAVKFVLLLLALPVLRLRLGLLLRDSVNSQYPSPQSTFH